MRSEYWVSHGNYMVDVYGKYQLMLLGGWPVSGAYHNFYCTTIYP